MESPVRSKKLILFVILASLMMGNSSASPATTKNITLAFQGPLTGPEAPIGISQLDAVKFAVHHFNNRYEGIFNVSMVLVDDQGDPAIAQQVAPAVAANPNIIGLVGSSYSGASIVSSISYKAANLPMISPSAWRASLTDPTAEVNGFPVFHRVIALDKSIAPTLYGVATKAINSPRVFIVDDQEPYGTNIGNELKTFAPAEQVVGIDSVPYNTTDFSPQIAKIRAAAANVLIFTGYELQAAIFFKQLRDGGYTGVIAGSDAIHNQSIFQYVNSSVLEGVRLVSRTAPLLSINKNLEDNFKEILGRSSGDYASEAINAVNVLLTCVARGSTTRSQMLACIDGFSGTSVYGQNFSFDVNGDVIPPGVYEVEISNGTFINKNNFGRSNQTSFEIISSFPWYGLCIKGGEKNRNSTSLTKCPPSYKPKK
jgi:branched-chain amino acid transport system substrate-binding protein